MSDLLHDLRTEREPVKEPARGWRNWWRCERDGARIRMRGGQVRNLNAGYVWRGKLYPSRDIAETVAAENKAVCVTWLGAYPEGERP